MLGAICELVKAGLSLNRAAEKLHVHHSTISRWREALPEFDAAVAAAEAEFIAGELANIRAAAKKSWQASAWLLERKFPSEFSQPQIQLSMGGSKVEYEELGDILKRMAFSPCAMRELEEMGDTNLLKEVQDIRQKELPVIDVPALPVTEG